MPIQMRGLGLCYWSRGSRLDHLHSFGRPNSRQLPFQWCPTAQRLTLVIHSLHLGVSILAISKCLLTVLCWELSISCTSRPLCSSLGQLLYQPGTDQHRLIWWWRFPLSLRQCHLGWSSSPAHARLIWVSKSHCARGSALRTLRVRYPMPPQLCLHHVSLCT